MKLVITMIFQENSSDYAERLYDEIVQYYKTAIIYCDYWNAKRVSCEFPNLESDWNLSNLLEPIIKSIGNCSIPAENVQIMCGIIASKATATFSISRIDMPTDLQISITFYPSGV